MSAQKFGASFFDSLFGISETCRLSDINEDSALSFPVCRVSSVLTNATENVPCLLYRITSMKIDFMIDPPFRRRAALVLLLSKSTVCGPSQTIGYSSANSTPYSTTAQYYCTTTEDAAGK